MTPTLTRPPLVAVFVEDDVRRGDSICRVAGLLAPYAWIRDDGDMVEVVHVRTLQGIVFDARSHYLRAPLVTRY